MPVRREGPSTWGRGAVRRLQSGLEECTDEDLERFDINLSKASGGCTINASYDWVSSGYPSAQEREELCKCKISDVEVPQCSVVKNDNVVTLYEAANDIFNHCPSADASPPAASSTAPAPSNSTATTIGIVGGIIVVAAIVGIGFYCRRKSRSKDHASTDYRHVALTPTTDPNCQIDMKGTEETVGTRTGTSTAPRHGGRNTESGLWEDPEITAVRIPLDAIFVGVVLSRGGFGEVYKGTYMGETVAIKKLLPARRKDMVQINNFLCEVKLMASLEHDRIVRFIGVAWNSLRDVCVVVEFMENGDLRSVLSRWRQGHEQRPTGFEHDKLKIAMHVAHALTYLHSLQPVVVHRDLKSKNILLDADMNAKLTDFGTSRERADSTMTAGVGTSLWMAPEVMMAERYNEKADIFSFGVVLAELDTHQLPYFHAKEPGTGLKIPDTAILQQVMLGRLSVKFTDGADPEIAQLGRDCVAMDEKQRPSAAEVLYRLHQSLRQYM